MQQTPDSLAVSFAELQPQPLQNAGSSHSFQKGLTS